MANDMKGENQAEAFLEHLARNEDDRRIVVDAVLQNIVEIAKLHGKGYNFSPDAFVSAVTHLINQAANVWFPPGRKPH